MPRSAFAQLPLDRRRRILDVAAEEFARSGFQGTSYNKLLERLGLGKSSAYYYFENKRDLFLTVVVDCYTSFFEALAELPVPRTAAEFWPWLLDAGVRGFEFMLRDPRASAVMRCMQSDPALVTELTSDRVLAGIADQHTVAIQLGQSLGAVRVDLPLELLVDSSRALSQSLDQWFLRAQAGDEPPGPRLAGERYADLVRRMLEAT